MTDWNSSPHSNQDRYLFHQGTHYRSYQWLGAHLIKKEGKRGVRFSLWAPNAREVRVVGDFNDWNGSDSQMHRIEDSGIWTRFVPGLNEGDIYKYEIILQEGSSRLKADPYGFSAEVRPQTASKVANLHNYQWQDSDWLQKRYEYNSYQQPMLIYEVHLGSWKQKNTEELLTYRELAKELIDYVSSMGYTHIELLPLVEHPFDGSWGYQATGYYAATSRYGSPTELMYLIDQAHQRGIGIILDWVPGHFCKDDHGLRLFDGTAQFEYDDPLRRENYGWGTSYFDLGKPEVLSYLISNAIFWFDVFHVDGLRVDAVASMLYLDYERGDSPWRSNIYGGRENLEAIGFLRKLNEVVFHEFPNVLMIAEESTTWPLVSHPTYTGGLGFNYKWNMGWMNDMLRYMEFDPIYRKYHHNLVTFSFMYTFSENFILPLSHDEVVHGKKSLLDKMPGDYWQKFASLRAFYGYMMAHPGKKLLFMGGEFGQFIEWKYKESLDWHLLEYPMHQSMLGYVKTLNHCYRKHRSLWYNDHNLEGFHWIDPHDHNQSIVTFIRQDDQEFTVIVTNFTPEVRYDYCIGVPYPGEYREILNSDRQEFGGSGQVNGPLVAKKEAWHNQPNRLELKIPPLATVYIQLVKPAVR